MVPLDSVTELGAPGTLPRFLQFGNGLSFQHQHLWKENMLTHVSHIADLQWRVAISKGFWLSHSAVRSTTLLRMFLTRSCVFLIWYFFFKIVFYHIAQASLSFTVTGMHYNDCVATVHGRAIFVVVVVLNTGDGIQGLPNAGWTPHHCGISRAPCEDFEFEFSICLSSFMKDGLTTWFCAPHGFCIWILSLVGWRLPKQTVEHRFPNKEWSAEVVGWKPFRAGFLSSWAF